MLRPAASAGRRRGRLRRLTGERMEKPVDGEGTSDTRRLYLDLLKSCLTRTVVPERYRPLAPSRPAWAAAVRALNRILGAARLEVVRPADVRLDARAEGRDLPPDAETMIGRFRLDHLQRSVEEILERGVAGDLIEAGVWRGGAVILMRAVLAAYGDETRVVWAADSFRGLPPPDDAAPPEERAHRRPELERPLAVSLEEVRANVARYGLLDDRVRFLAGFFKDTLSSAPPGPLALIRLDADLYESTRTALRHLYPRLSPGGVLIVDDYGEMPGCRRAVDEFREAEGIGTPMTRVDRSCIAWRREA